MTDGKKRFKPGVSQRVHIACAALLWTGIGVMLLYRGITFILPGESAWFIIAGLVIGMLKSILILDRVARRGIERIMHFSDDTCIGAVYSWKTWVMVLAMMLFGMVMRHLGIASWINGLVCTAIGSALLLSSRHSWNAWIGWNAKPST